MTRVRTPTVLQVEAVECGAAALCIVLGYYGRYVPLEQMREECGVSRDGSKASNLVKVARTYGFTALGKRLDLEGLRKVRLPAILFWQFRHFLVLEGFGKDRVYLNDPASGPCTVTYAELDESFTGVCLVFEPTDQFKPGGRVKSLTGLLGARLRGLAAPLSFVLLSSLALVIPGLALPLLLRIFVDVVLAQPSHPWLGVLLGAMAATAAVRAVLVWLQQSFLARLETLLAMSWSARYFWHLLRLPAGFFAQRMAGDIGMRVGLNDRVAQLLSGQIASAALNILTVGFYVLLMALYDPTLTAVVALLAAVNVAVLVPTLRVLDDASMKLQNERSHLFGLTVGGLSMIETLKACGREGDFFSRWSGRLAKQVTAEQEQNRTAQMVAAVPPLVAALGTAIVLTVGALRVMDGALSLGMLAAFVALTASLNDPLNELVNQLAHCQQVRADLVRLNDVLAFKTDADLEASAVPTVERLSGWLELRGITFGYSPLDEPLIRDFNLSLQPGQRVALVGSSGSGKSTLGRIISGLHEPWSGTVLLDGRPRRDVPRAVRLNSMAHVDQEISLFEGTVRDNLTMWDPSTDEATLLSALRDAGMSDVVLARPGGLDASVADGGWNWSGGERQRLEIARALAGHPSILVLDEATSALDPLVEKHIDAALRSRGCTCVIVAHRLSTIRDCDEIVVLERGKVVERGRHETLVAVDGPYRRLVEAES